MQRALQLVFAAWAGSLWTICGVVAPSLFAVIADRKLAGEVAGHFFTVAMWLGVALGSASWLLARSVGSKRLDRVLVAVAMLAPVASEFGLRPLMTAARVAGDMSRFGILHGVSALLFGVACVCTLVLLWRSTALQR